MTGLKTARLTSASERLFAESQRLIPGGVNSPVRAFKGVGGTPRFIARGEGAWLVDADGNRYVDLVLSWGPLILGHAHPEVLEAIVRAAEAGHHVRRSDRARAPPGGAGRRHLPLGGHGAVRELRHRSRHERRAAGPRGHRSLGGGQVRRLLSRARRPPPRRRRLRRRHPRAPRFARRDCGRGGATRWWWRSTTSPRWRSCSSAVASEIAAVLVEPVPGNMGVVPPVSGFLQGLRALTRRHGALLVFDEVMTGWRVHPRGAQVLYGIEPDLTCMGKVVGGGLPAAAYGGRRDLMEQVAPAGPGVSGRHALGQPSRDGRWTRHARRAGTRRHLGARRGVGEAGGGSDRAPGPGGRGGRDGATGRHHAHPFLHCRPGPRLRHGARAPTAPAYNAFFHAMLDAGVYLPPSAFEAAFTSAVHGEAELGAIEAALASAWRR